MVSIYVYKSIFADIYQDKACAELDSDEDLPADVNEDEDERIETDSEEERELEMQRRIQQASMEKDKVW